MSSTLLTAVLAGLLAILAIMLRGLYVMETNPSIEHDAHEKLNTILPWRDAP